MSFLKNPLTRTLRRWAVRALRADHPAPARIRIEHELLFRYVATHVTADAVYVECGPAAGEGAALLIPRLGFAPRNCYLVEACPENCAVLREKLPGCTVSNYAVADRRGRVGLFVFDDPREAGSSRSNAMDEKSLLAKNVTRLRRIEVDSIGLTEYFAQQRIEQCTYLHLNIEGGEYALFSGDLAFLDRCRFVYLDLHWGLYMGETSEDAMLRRKLAIHDRLLERGFELLAGYRREEVALYPTHQTTVWQRR